MGQRRQRIVDDLLDLWSTGATLSPGRGAWGRDAAGAALTIDTGGGFTEGFMVVDVSTSVKAPAAASAPQFNLFLEGSNTAGGAFTTGVPLALLQFGRAGYAIKASPAFTASVLGTGRWLVPFTNDFGGSLYRYLRMYVTTGGTLKSGIQFSAFLSK